MRRSQTVWVLMDSPAAGQALAQALQARGQAAVAMASLPQLTARLLPPAAPLPPALQPDLLVLDTDAPAHAAAGNADAKAVFAAKASATDATLGSPSAPATTTGAITSAIPDAMAALQALRRHSRLPVIMLCRADEPADRVLALQAGADDSLAKPLAVTELLARMAAVLRRVQGGPGSAAAVLQTGAWALDPMTRALTRDGAAVVRLTEAEFRLMRAFFEQPRHVLLRSDLLALADPPSGAAGANLGAQASQPAGRAIDLLVSRLRGKLGDDARSPRWIQTVRGRGYRFNLPAR